jgi:RNA polymerase sigma-70 factor (ECF subfamily)
MPEQMSPSGSSDAAGFAATHWTLVLSAARGSETPRAAAAMAELCRTYWYPLYAYVRRRNLDAHEAEDLTQEFFVRLIGKNYLADVDRRKGKFRAFLLAAMKHFLADEWDRSRAQKRGGGRVLVSLDGADADIRYRREPAHDLTPEKLYERQWAIAVLQKVLARLREEFLAEGKVMLFDRLEPFLAGERATTHAQAAAELKMTENAVKKAVHRLRRRFRQGLREEIAHTVASPEEIDEEIHYLLRCL